MAKIKRRPTADKFIEDAGKTETEFPWDAADPNKIKVYNLRLPEPIFEKLKFIGDSDPFMSMQRFCQETLRPAIDAKIQELTE
jgi:hypothetical protein